jgi:hypothetical protein
MPEHFEHEFSLRAQLRHLALLEAERVFEEILSSSETPQAMQETLIAHIKHERSRLGIDPTTQYSMQTPDEWETLPQPVVYVDADGKKHHYVPKEAYVLPS